jgi:hypothetical protein
MKMKSIYLLLLISLSLLACKKTSPCPSSTYYTSNGNLLILQLGEHFEGAYEFDLAYTALNNDSLPLSFESYLGPQGDVTSLRILPNPIPIFQLIANTIQWNTPMIDPTKLQQLPVSYPLDTSEIQAFGNPGNPNYPLLWDEISKLDIVHTYRKANPNTPVTVMKLVTTSYNPELGFSVPSTKHLIFLVR